MAETDSYLFSFDALRGVPQWQMALSGIYQPLTTRYVRRASGLIVPMSDLEKQVEYFITKYDCIASYRLISGNGEHPHHIKDKQENICRFCGKDKEHDGEKFPKNGHAISELIGNKSLFLDNECDTCNKGFGRNIEDQFAKYLGPARTIAQTIGKNGIPSHKDNNGAFRIDYAKTLMLIQDVAGSGLVDIKDDHIDLHLVKQTYTPIAAFKALVFMALSIMPEDEFKVFKTTVDWIREENHEQSKYNMSDYASKVIERFVPGPKPLPIQAIVARRKPEVTDAPYCIFVLEFDNFCFQIVVPCPEKDGVLWRKNVKTYVFPSTFDIYEKEYKKFGYTGMAIKDLSGRTKVKGEKSEISVSFGEVKEAGDIVGRNTVEVAKQFGVKPLKIKKKKVLLAFGTRPEAIKLCPLILELKNRDSLDVKVCVTAQHRQMLDQVLYTFGVVPDYDLNIMKDRQNLFDITTNILNKIKDVLDEVKPDVVLVHGDTSTTFVTALACFYLQIPVAHVEAGLRTYNIYSPYPEEFNREAVSIVSQYNFAPTPLSRSNLLREGRKPENIYVTGNTVIDAMQHTVKEDFTHPELDWVGDDKLIFITAHRRENLGEPMHHMFRAIRRVLDEHPDCKAVYPIHMNPVVREAAEQELGGCDRIHIIEPIEVFDCHNFEARSFLCLTDSGGIQEECPSYGVPVLVMRDTTERPEGVDAGTLKLVGTDEETIYKTFKLLLENKEEYDKMSKACNPYGDGHACERIADILEGKEYSPWKPN